MAIATAGYAVLRGPLATAALATAREAVVNAVRHAGADDVHVGSTSVRVNGILGRVPELAALLDHKALLDVAREVIGGPFRLSSLHSRSVKPGAGSQALHQDVAPGAEAWPLAGFILMLDPFTRRNGATRFLPGSGGLTELSATETEPPSAEMACGPAGSLIVFDGSTWHGHSANATARWRHSVQGAFIPRRASPSVDFERTLPGKTLRGLSSAARGLL